MALTVYKASAGSGKTFTLAAEYIKYLIVNPYEYRSILAVTFTNKATAEMKERIIYYLNDIATGSPNEEGFFNKIKKYKEVVEEHLSDEQIRKRAEKALTGILHDYSRFRIETIDSFFQSVVRELAHELDLTANLRVDLNDNEVLSDAVNSIIEDIGHDKTILNIINNFIEDKTEEGKNWHINNELELFGKNIFKEKYLQLSQEAREAIGNTTFLRDYKSKIQNIRNNVLDELKDTGNKFMDTCAKHGYCVDNFKNKGKGIYSFFNKLTKGTLDINKTAMKCAESTKEWTKEESDATLLNLIQDEFLPMLKALIEKEEEYTIKLNTSTAILNHINHLMLLNVINSKVRTLNQEANRFLIADTAYFLNQLIADSDIPFIYERMGTRFNHIMIDEFQDTSSLQWKNFTPLISNSLASNYGCLIVGDVKQSIYRWRNSDWQILNNINEGEFCEYVDQQSLDTNYRSVENIINFNNQFFKNACENINKSFAEKYDFTSEDLKNAYSDVKQNVAENNEGMGFVGMRAVSKSDDQSYTDVTLDEMANIIKDLQDNGVQNNEITILVRENKFIPIICEYFTRNKGIVDVEVVSDEAFRLDFSTAINMLIMALHYLADSQDKFALANLVFNYKKEVEKDEEENISNIFLRETEEILNMLPNEFGEKVEELTFLPLLELVEQLYKILHLDSIQKQDAYMFFFHDQMSAYCEDNKTDLHSFLTFWEEVLCSKTIPINSIDGIRIMSVHKSKGLAFPTVIMPFCDWKLVKNGELIWCEPNTDPYNELQLTPLSLETKLNDSIFSKDYQEELLRSAVDNINILYVGFTRAENNLIIITDINKIAEKKDDKKNSKKKKEDEENNIETNVINDVAKLLAKSMPEMTFTEDKDSNTMTWETGTILSNEQKKAIKTQRKESKGQNKDNKKEKDQVEKVYSEFCYHDSIVNYRQSNNSSKFINEEDGNDKFSFIDRGLLYHSILERIETTDDIDLAIDKAIEEVYLEGCIDSNSEKEEIATNLHNAFKNEQASEWFAPIWNVYNERSIIFKTQANMAVDRRPDRVITLPSKEKAIVIDYKTGSEHTKKYTDQVQFYKKLLRDMGYKEVKGFIWYVLEDKIEEK